MWQGSVHSIYIAQKGAEPMVSVPDVRAVAGKGLEGDRYLEQTGTWSGYPNVFEVTLIEIETFEALKQEYRVELPPGVARRNIVTRGVALNHLSDREFLVGEVRLRGGKLCHACRHLDKFTYTGIRTHLQNRGGLRAQILNGGVIRVGDAVQEAKGTAASREKGLGWNERRARLFVSNLSQEVTDEDLLAVFAPYGKVTTAQVVKDLSTGRSKRMGFVDMPHLPEAYAAMAALNGKDLKGSPLSVGRED